MFKPRLINPPKTVSADAIPDNPKSQYKNPRNSYLITEALSTYLITRDSCPLLEQLEAPSITEKN